MKAWRITFASHNDNVYTEVYTRWNDVLFVKMNYELIEMQEITL